MEIPENTILYNNQNLYSIAYLRVFSYRSFLAPLRERKITVPGRSGAYDAGARYHDERLIRCECLIERPISAIQFDELKYVLSRKGRIVFWDQTDRIYIGQTYSEQEVLEYARRSAATFPLEFVCEPYAYAPTPTVLTSTQEIIHPHYEGTRDTPTRITIHNRGTTDLYGVTITARVER